MAPIGFACARATWRSHLPASISVTAPRVRVCASSCHAWSSLRTANAARAGWPRDFVKVIVKSGGVKSNSQSS
eukprot:3825586-Prymnesium_polylepis.1